jgi:CubicO group peptidase (beta-lactamase class C family)
LLLTYSVRAAEPQIAPALQPFVESHSLAGAVTVAANKDKVLNLETVGFMDVGAKKPMQADCLFWIASISKPITGTGLMLLNGGELNGKRYLSSAALKTMTSKQTGDGVKDGYGIGWSTNGMTYGHGGALATNMTIDPQRGLITVFLVQRAGFPGDGGKSHGAFVKAAQEAFAK